MIELLHDVYFLVDVFLEKGFLLDMQLADDFNGMQKVS